MRFVLVILRIFLRAEPASSPYYFVPSSMTWQFGLGLIFLVLLIQNQTPKNQSIVKSFVSYLSLFILFGLCCCLFHYLTAFVIALILFILLLFNSGLFQQHRFLFFGTIFLVVCLYGLMSIQRIQSIVNYVEVIVGVSGSTSSIPKDLLLIQTGLLPFLIIAGISGHLFDISRISENIELLLLRMCFFWYSF